MLGNPVAGWYPVRDGKMARIKLRILDESPMPNVPETKFEFLTVYGRTERLPLFVFVPLGVVVMT